MAKNAAMEAMAQRSMDAGNSTIWTYDLDHMSYNAPHPGKTPIIEAKKVKEKGKSALLRMQTCK